jgi:LCP family protein required for cell wall assembly
MAHRLRPKWRWLYLYLPLLVVLLVAGSLAWVFVRFNSIHRIDLGDALSPASGPAVNYLLVGSDSREGIDASTPNVGAIGTNVTGHRSDTIIALRVEGGKATMMSIPRDLWATIVATGRNGRINAAYNQSPANLVRTVTANLGVAVNHYIEVDFVSFSRMVDAIGGIDIDFPHPAFDRNSGLNIITAGTHHLDGSQALAYVRSRHYVEVVDGRHVPDPTGDLGRNQRQQTFIRTVLHEVGATRNPWTLAKVVNAAVGGMRADTELGFGDVFSLARNLSGSDPASVVLPTRPARKGAAAVLLLRSAEATPVLAQFGGSAHAPS